MPNQKTLHRIREILLIIETESTNDKEEKTQESNSSSTRFKSYSEKQLKAALKKAVEDEDYEKAVALRDELEQRNQ
jgi:protein-arginine kinase activator protein McsA